MGHRLVLLSQITDIVTYRLNRPRGQFSEYITMLAVVKLLLTYLVFEGQGASLSKCFLWEKRNIFGCNYNVYDGLTIPLNVSYIK